MIIKNILTGEDIRQEVGNKLSLMGILGSSLNVNIPQTAPKNAEVSVPLAFLITIENTDPANDPKNFNVLISLSVGGNKLVDMTARIESKGYDRIINLPVPKIEFRFRENTSVNVCAEIMKESVSVSKSSTVLDVQVNRT
ncbi:hypothetical protein [Trichlorobacter lovleyi]|uniref:hypothetical protein n=1 Tax=Trichlorobacter lovleyi TaxID=313985 RepID=UPI0024818BE1|nr:hypothetical protein [Trichlorobacter lovleyi]